MKGSHFWRLQSKSEWTYCFGPLKHLLHLGRATLETRPLTYGPLEGHISALMTKGCKALREGERT